MNETMYQEGRYKTLSDKQISLYLKTDKIIVTCIKTISYISGICLVGIMLIAFFNVIGEKFFATGIPMTTEIITYLHIPLVFLGAAFVTLDNGHVKIDLLSSKFSLKLQRIFTTFGFLCGTAICGFISARGIVQMLKFIARHKKSSVTGLGFDLWPFALILSIGFAMLAISFLWAIVRQYVNVPTVQKHAPEGIAELEAVKEEDL